MLTRKMIEWRLIRRLLMAVGLVALAGCLVLILNITAPNPAHRRSSSRVILTSVNGASSQAIGLDGETVLAADLHLPSNNDPDQRVCFCKTASLKPNNCLSCAVSYWALNASFRIPDFYGNGIIAESKNRQTLSADDKDLLSQLDDYRMVAIVLNRPLWIYVRVDSEVDPVYARLAANTHGGIVYYFATPGYSDPVDQAARTGAAASAVGILAIGLWDIAVRPRRARSDYSPEYVIPVRPAAPDTDSSAPGSNDPTSASQAARRSRSPLAKTIEALDNADNIARQTRDKLDL